jgi:ferric-dicitrate binding protein FerR (iron transport regulator)
MKKDIDFLNDDKLFILWRLTRDSELEAYWNKFVSDNPAIKDEFEKAVAKFSSLHLNKIQPDADDVERLLQRINDSVSRRKRQRTRRFFVRCAAAACITLMAGLYIYYYARGDREETMPDRTIVCENLEAEDIRLITNRETKTFAKDVVISVDKNGKTTIRETGNESTVVVEAKKTEMGMLVVPYGKRSQLELSDGTKVWLNSGSVLEFPAVFTGRSREIRLNGEIYVEAAKDEQRPFIVHVGDFDVRVYGTKFNISAYGDTGIYRVTLVEGKVGVKSVSHGETLLHPNDMLTCGQDEWKTSTVDVAEHISWKDGYLLLDDTPMEEVLQRLERYYNLSFRTGDDVRLAAKTCTGKIILSVNPDEVMETVALLVSAKYERDEKTIRISHK